MTQLLTYRTYQSTFRLPITHISDTFLIYQAERKRQAPALAIDLKALDGGGHFWRHGDWP
jgi:hypothetical protein